MELATLAAGIAIGAGAIAPVVTYALNGWLRLSREHLRTTIDLRDMTAAFKTELAAHETTRANENALRGLLDDAAAQRDAVQAHLNDALKELVANRPLIEIGRKDRARRQKQNDDRKTARAKRNAA